MMLVPRIAVPLGPSVGSRVHTYSYAFLSHSTSTGSCAQNPLVGVGKQGQGVPLPSVQQIGRRNFRKIEVSNAVSTDDISVETSEPSSELDQDEFDKRFKPPHVTDLFDVQARPSTFCANPSFTRYTENGSKMCFSENLGKIFVHDDDRVLLKGAATTCYVATSPDLKGVSNKYFVDCNESSKLTPQANNMEMAAALWNFSNNFVSNH